MTTNSKSKPNPSPKPGRDASWPPLTTEATKRKILVVDDDSQIRESLRKVLLAEGYAVMLAADGREVMDKFGAERIDLLILDLNLPVTSGWDIFGTLTSLNPFLPIVIITGRQNQEELAAEAGVAALMQKPLDVPRLLQIIAELFAEPAEKHLKRLAGLDRDLRHVPSAHPVSSNATSIE